MTETPSKPIPRARFDGNDVMLSAGLALLGAGLAFAVSWPVALAAVGAVLVIVSTANAFTVLVLSMAMQALEILKRGK